MAQLTLPDKAPAGSRKTAATTLLVSVVAAAVICTLFSGALLYSTTARLIESAKWVDHTMEVLVALQSTSRIVERAALEAHLYTASGLSGQFSSAQADATRLEVSADHIASLMSDNPGEAANVKALSAQSAALRRAADILPPPTDATLDNTAKVSPLASPARACLGTLERMAEQERRLLNERNDTNRHNSFVSFVMEGAFIALSLITLLGLFAFFLRDAAQRHRTGSEMAASNASLAASIYALEDRANESSLLTDARDELQLCVNLPQVYQTATRNFERLIPISTGALCLINNSRNLVETVSSWGATSFEDLHPPEACCGLRSGHPRLRQPGTSEIHCAHFAEQEPQKRPERYLCKPISAHGETMGILYIECANDAAIAIIRERMDGLRQLVQLTGMTIAALNLRNKLESQSIRDPLTNLFNRHFLGIALEREVARASRRNTTLAVLMLDVDHFKRFNDIWGHAAGDKVLKAAAAVFTNQVRAEDIVCRYGGEEFVIILPDITPEDAFGRAESVRIAVSQERIPIERLTFGEVTVSIGLAIYPSDAHTSESLLRLADEALYRAKDQGRNQVSLSVAGSVA